MDFLVVDEERSPLLKHVPEPARLVLMKSEERNLERRSE